MEPAQCSDVVIVGGGIAGCLAAALIASTNVYYITSRGVRRELERDDFRGAHVHVSHLRSKNEQDDLASRLSEIFRVRQVTSLALISLQYAAAKRMRLLSWGVAGEAVEALVERLSLAFMAVISNVLTRLAMRKALGSVVTIEYVPELVAFKKIPSPNATDEDSLTALAA